MNNNNFSNWNANQVDVQVLNNIKRRNIELELGDKSLEEIKEEFFNEKLKLDDFDGQIGIMQSNLNLAITTANNLRERVWIMLDIIAEKTRLEKEEQENKILGVKKDGR